MYFLVEEGKKANFDNFVHENAQYFLIFPFLKH